jgi:hypothetical protein
MKNASWMFPLLSCASSHSIVAFLLNSTLRSNPPLWSHPPYTCYCAFGLDLPYHWNLTSPLILTFGSSSLLSNFEITLQSCSAFTTWSCPPNIILISRCDLARLSRIDSCLPCNFYLPCDRPHGTWDSGIASQQLLPTAKEKRLVASPLLPHSSELYSPYIGISSKKNCGLFKLLV